MKYQYTTIDGEPKLVPENPCSMLPYSYVRLWREFNEANPPLTYIGSPLPEGAVLDEGEVEIVWQYKDYGDSNEWKEPQDDEDDRRYTHTQKRQVATLKEPAIKEERR